MGGEQYPASVRSYEGVNSSAELTCGVDHHIAALGVLQYTAPSQYGTSIHLLNCCHSKACCTEVHCTGSGRLYGGDVRL